MRSRQWQLGILGTISAFAQNHLSICLEPSQHFLRTISAFAQNHLSICLEPSQHLLRTISAFTQNHLSICLEPSQHLLRTISAFAQNHLSICLEPSQHLLCGKKGTIWFNKKMTQGLFARQLSRQVLTEYSKMQYLTQPQYYYYYYYHHYYYHYQRLFCKQPLRSSVGNQ